MWGQNVWGNFEESCYGRSRGYLLFKMFCGKVRITNTRGHFWDVIFLCRGFLDKFAGNIGGFHVKKFWVKAMFGYSVEFGKMRLGGSNVFG